MKEERKKAVKDQHRFLNCQKWSKRNGKRVLLLHLNLPANLSVFSIYATGTKFAFQSAQAAAEKRRERQDKTKNVWHLTSANRRYISNAGDRVDGRYIVYGALLCIDRRETAIRDFSL
jgi:hypothetical protein